MDWGVKLAEVYSHISVTGVLMYFGLFVVTWWVYNNLMRPFLSPLRKLPGKPYRPIVGNMFEATRAEAMSNAVRWMKECKSKTIRFYGFNGQERILTADPQVFRQVLVTNSNNYNRITIPGRAKALLGRALFFLSGQEHHTMRKLLNPAFGMRVLNEMVPIFATKAGNVMKLWKDLLNKDGGSEGLDIHVEDFVTRLALDSICDIGFDYHPEAIAHPESQEVRSFVRILRGILQRSLTALIPFYSKFPSKQNIQIDGDLKCVRQVIQETITAKRKYFEEKGAYLASEQPKDLLSLLLLAKDEQGNSIDEATIYQNVAGLLFAGFDTTSTSLTWVMLQLALYPDVQEKVRQEVMSVLIRSQETAITQENIEQMHYLSCVIKETQRLYPPISNISRVSVNDDIIDGYHIPGGSTIVLHIGALHRLDENWDDPETFNPDRFLQDHEPYKFLPFITGPYVCIGQKFALLEIKTVLASILREFELSMTPGYKFRRVQALTVRPHPPLVLRLRHRE